MARVTCIASGTDLAEADAVALSTIRRPGRDPVVVVDRNGTMTSPTCYLTRDAVLLDDVFASGLIEEALGLGRAMSVREKAHVRKEVTELARERMAMPHCHEHARALALAAINPVPPPDPAPHIQLAGQLEPSEYVILDEHTIERKWGWVFHYGAASSEPLVEGDAPLELLAGAGPIFVNRHDGSIEQQGSASSTEEYLKEYEREL